MPTGAYGMLRSFTASQKNVNTYTYPLPACVPIPTRDLKFPQRTPGQTPTPAVNKFALTLDYLSLFSPPFNVAGSVIGFFGNLTIQAMAPVIMVHGWDSGPWWVGTEPESRSELSRSRRLWLRRRLSE